MKILTDLETQTQLAEEGGVIPNQEGAFVGHEGNEFLLVADEASTNSRFTPVSPNWANVEASQVLQDMLVNIFSGNASAHRAIGLTGTGSRMPNRRAAQSTFHGEKCGPRQR